MEKTVTAALLDELAVAILQVTATGRDHFYLYAQVEPGVVAPSFFQVVGDDLVYTDPTDEMIRALSDLWDAAEPSGRWRAIRLEMIGGWSKAEFDHATAPDAPEMAFYGDGDGDDDNPNAPGEQDRRMLAALRTRFGEGASIVYPSITRHPLQRSLDFTGTEPIGARGSA